MILFTVYEESDTDVLFIEYSTSANVGCCSSRLSSSAETNSISTWLINLQFSFCQISIINLSYMKIVLEII